MPLLQLPLSIKSRLVISKQYEYTSLKNIRKMYFITDYLKEYEI